MEIDNATRAWLEVKPKEKQAMSYDFGGCCYGNMTINLSEVFNNVLKTVHGLPVSTLV
jgi:hypothetical protein